MDSQLKLNEESAKLYKVLGWAKITVANLGLALVNTELIIIHLIY